MIEREQALQLIHEYTKTVCFVVGKILHKHEKYSESTDLKSIESFWKLYIQKEIPKRNSLKVDENTIEYNFHGGGCFLKYNDVEVDTSFYTESGEFVISYSVDKLWNFMKSSNNNIDFKSRFELDEILEKMCLEGLIFRSVSLPFKVYHSGFEILSSEERTNKNKTIGN
jgi:hypothetical protein